MGEEEDDEWHVYAGPSLTSEECPAMKVTMPPAASRLLHCADPGAWALFIVSVDAFIANSNEQ